jgi:hypothetical protein
MEMTSQKKYQNLIEAEQVLMIPIKVVSGEIGTGEPHLMVKGENNSQIKIVFGDPHYGQHTTRWTHGDSKKSYNTTTTTNGAWIASISARGIWL